MIFHSTIDMVYKNRPFNLVEQWFVIDVVVKAKKKRVYVTTTCLLYFMRAPSFRPCESNTQATQVMQFMQDYGSSDARQVFSETFPCSKSRTKKY